MGKVVQLFSNSDKSWKMKGKCGLEARELKGWELQAYLDRFHGTAEEQEIAKKVCIGCPVAEKCFEEGYKNWYEGVWGGTTLRERKKYRRQYRFDRRVAAVRVLKERGAQSQDKPNSSPELAS